MIAVMNMDEAEVAYPSPERQARTDTEFPENSAREVPDRDNGAVQSVSPDKFVGSASCDDRFMKKKDDHEDSEPMSDYSEPMSAVEECEPQKHENEEQICTDNFGEKMCDEDLDTSGSTECGEQEDGNPSGKDSASQTKLAEQRLIKEDTEDDTKAAETAVRSDSGATADIITPDSPAGNPNRTDEVRLVPLNQIEML